MRATKSRGRRPSLCYGKIRYRDRKSAKAAMAAFRTVKKENPDAHVPTRYYRCYRCEGWHLTSTSAEDYEAAREATRADTFAETYRKRREDMGRDLRLRAQREKDRKAGGKRRSDDDDLALRTSA